MTDSSPLICAFRAPEAKHCLRHEKLRTVDSNRRERLTTGAQNPSKKGAPLPQKSASETCSEIAIAVSRVGVEAFTQDNLRKQDYHYHYADTAEIILPTQGPPAVHLQG